MQSLVDPDDINLGMGNKIAKRDEVFMPFQDRVTFNRLTQLQAEGLATSPANNDCRGLAKQLCKRKLDVGKELEEFMPTILRSRGQ